MLALEVHAFVRASVFFKIRFLLCVGVPHCLCTRLCVPLSFSRLYFCCVWACLTVSVLVVCRCWFDWAGGMPTGRVLQISAGIAYREEQWAVAHAHCVELLAAAGDRCCQVLQQ